MSKEALAKVVQRAISDGAFRRQLSSDPSGALRGFDLTADEAAAVRTGDAGRLSALGIDQRMSKAFTFSGSAGAATKLGGTDITSTYGSATTTGDPSGVGGNALVVGGTSSDGDALIGYDGAKVASAATDGGDAMGTVIPSDPTLQSGMLPNDPAHAYQVLAGGTDAAGNSITAGDGGQSDLYPSDPMQASHTYSGDDIAGPNAVTSGDESDGMLYPNDPHTGSVFSDGGGGAALPTDTGTPEISQ